jgi:transcriptional regulator with XRE-family HTH domain
VESKADILQRFGAHVRELRRERGISQERLATLAGLDRTYVGGIERGERNVALVNILKLARGLEVEPQELLEPFG